MKSFGLISCPVMLICFVVQAEAQLAPARAPNQEIFSANGKAQGNPNCPPPVINGITPNNWSCRTDTQGVQGNPNCPAPVGMIDGIRTSPVNWSCPGTQSLQNIPRTAPVAGPPGSYISSTANGTAPNDGPPGSYLSGTAQVDRPPGSYLPMNADETNPNYRPPGSYISSTANPCQPGGTGGYSWLANPEGTQLPTGCARGAGGSALPSNRPDPRVDVLRLNNPSQVPAPPGRVNPVGGQSLGPNYRNGPMATPYQTNPYGQQPAPNYRNVPIPMPWGNSTRR